MALASPWKLSCTSDGSFPPLVPLPSALGLSARRTAVTLIGSNVAFKTSTGACMTEACPAERTAASPRQINRASCPAL